MTPIPGERVFAIRNADQDTVYLFGKGVYAGDFPFPVSVTKGVDLGDATNPRIDLDDGTQVWGFECWWGEEARYPEVVQGRKEVLITERLP